MLVRLFLREKRNIQRKFKMTLKSKKNLTAPWQKNEKRTKDKQSHIVWLYTGTSLRQTTVHNNNIEKQRHHVPYQNPGGGGWGDFIYFGRVSSSCSLRSNRRVAHVCTNPVIIPIQKVTFKKNWTGFCFVARTIETFVIK